jgi:energy-coupling factor transporter ATP-binding protein EcfA2
VIAKIQLTNFRCFSDHTVPLRPLTVIVGQNNAGKSSLVDALRLIARVASRYRRLQFVSPPRWLDIPKQHRGVSPSIEGIDVTFDTVFHRYNEPPALITATLTSGESIRLYIGPEGAVFAVLCNKEGRPVTTPGAIAKMRIPNVSALPQVAPLLREEEVLVPDYVRRFMNTDRAPLHFRNELRLLPDAFRRFKTFVEPTWPGLQIRDLMERNRKLTLLVRDSDFTAEVAWMGHGLQMWLQVMWFVARTDRQSTVILDEPDVYLHADLQRKLVRLIRTRYAQTIVATHSVEIMAEVDPENVLIIDRRRPASRFASTLPAVQRVVERIGGIHNLQLARLWSSRKCLLVEGKDIAVLRRWQAALFPESSEPFDALPNMAIGGWSGWPYAVGSSMLLRNAGGETIRVYCVLDRDYHCPMDVERRMREAEDRGVRLHVWSRKEIENYLLVPSLIARVITGIKTQKGAGPSEAEVAESLSRFAEGMRDETLDALATELHAADRAGGVPRANRLARDRVEGAWQTLEGKLSVVSGKQLLSALSSWSQATYGTSLSVGRLAAMMLANEVLAEVRGVVSAIELGKTLGESE